MDRRRAFLVGIGAILLALIAFGAYRYYALSKGLNAAREELTETKTAQEARERELTGALAIKTAESERYYAAYVVEAKKTGSFESQIARISGTVGTLEKLAKTDPELLAKYSKVYFLNENYVPPALAAIPNAFVYEKSRTLELHKEVEPYLEDLLEDAREDGIDLMVVSAYRSFGQQASLKAQYRVTYGSGANAFSADQGYSEHQLGTTVDFTTALVGGSFAGFDKTESYAWLTENAWRYGFVLSYPKGNAYYQYEPWHWRFVGTDLARKLHEDKQHFYDLDQRTIDTYLASLFD